MRVLLIDNYDSFVYNLAQVFGSLGAEPVVVRNDATIESLQPVNPDAVVISPGPGAPADSGVSMEAIAHFAGVRPILGVCLGHQCIAAAFGGRIVRAPVGPVHGKTAMVTHTGDGMFRNIESPFVATRYHSLALDEASVPAVLQVTARSDDGTIMGVRHRDMAVEGVQFHPESVLCREGETLLENFLRDVERSEQQTEEAQESQ